MSKYNSLGGLFTAIANAIRAKTGGTDPIVAEDFPAAVEGISAGGGDDALKMATGEIILAQNYSSTSINTDILIEHNLGVIPQVLVLVTDEPNFTDYNQFFPIYEVVGNDVLISGFAKNKTYYGNNIRFRENCMTNANATKETMQIFFPHENRSSLQYEAGKKIIWFVWG